MHHRTFGTGTGGLARNPLLWGLGTAAAVALGYRVYQRWPRLRLRGRTALVTGGSRGLGAAIVRELLRAGMRVAFCARDRDDVMRTVQELRSLGRVYGRVCDVTDAAAVQSLVATVTQHMGPIDVLVNNAGQMLVGPVQHMTRADFHAAMDVHYGGPLNTMLAVLPGMRARRLGHIVNIASIGGVVPIPHMAPYVASKFALVGMSRALREELGRDGIRITTVCPGPLRTGSPLRVRFQGRYRDEFTWFGASEAMPFVSTGGLRAARRIVAAVRSGEADVTIGVPAKLLRLFDGAAPGFMCELLGLIERGVLPAPVGLGIGTRCGEDSDADALQRP